MDKELIRKIIASSSATLQEFAKVANSTAEHLYSVLVRQQLVTGVAMLLGLVYFISSTTWIVGRVWNKWKEKDAETGSYIIILFIMANFVTTMIIGEAIMRITNPEYYAIEFIFKSVR